MRRHKLKRITVDGVDCRDGGVHLSYVFDKSKYGAFMRTWILLHCHVQLPHCHVDIRYLICTMRYSRAGVADIRRMRAFRVALIRQYYNEMQHQYASSICFFFFFSKSINWLFKLMFHREIAFSRKKILVKFEAQSLIFLKRVRSLIDEKVSHFTHIVLYFALYIVRTSVIWQ